MYYRGRGGGGEEIRELWLTHDKIYLIPVWLYNILITPHDPHHWYSFPPPPPPVSPFPGSLGNETNKEKNTIKNKKSKS